MTIVEAIKTVLQDAPGGLSSEEIYDRIVQRGLYVFGAKKPVAVVNGEIRRRCSGLDFPTAFPIKQFEILSYRGKKPLFGLLHNKESTSAIKGKHKTITISSLEQLPEERINSVLKEHYTAIKQQIIECIMANSPSFFEHLVMDLLLKMGYGCDESSGIVTGRSHDGGVDGKISEDKLGLDQIYIQAKRHSYDNRIGRKEIQAFIGAMEHVHKGVFITTSFFTREAVNFIEKQQQKNIKLIDGDLLADLLLKYEVGISPVQTFSLYRIDSDYYNES